MWNCLQKIIPGSDAVIHLACISNDPSFELNPDLGKSINYDAFLPLVQISKRTRCSGLFMRHRRVFMASRKLTM